MNGGCVVLIVGYYTTIIFPFVEMYAELIFNYLIGEQCPDVELPSPVEQSPILGRSKKFLFSELQVGCNSILNIFNIYM